ncbi:MAG: response regulator [Bacteroidota bacterium]
MNTNNDFKILVVDDDLVLRSIIETLLIKAGYLVQTAVDGAECMRIMERFHPDLLLLDVILPDADGVELCQLIKSDPELSSTFIILISGIKTETDNIADGLETGADGYLIKPFIPREFLARIKSAKRVVIAEKVLRLSEEKFAIAFRSASQAIAITRVSDGLIHDVNESFARITGYTLAEAVGKTTLELNLWVNEDDRKMVVSTLNNGGKVSALEFKLRVKSGAQIIALFSCEIITVHNDSYMLSSITDITDIIRKEQLLKQSETRFKLLIENSPDAITLIGQDGAFRYISNSALRMFGYSPEDLTSVPLSPAELTHPDDLHFVLVLLTDLQQNPEKVITCRYRFRHKNQTWRWIESTFTNLFAEPAVEAIVINFHDITERKRSEKIQNVLYTIAKAAVTNLNIEEFLTVTREQLSLLLDTTNFFVAFYREETQTLRRAIWIDENDKYEEWKAENSLSGQVVKKGVTLLLTREEIDKIAEENGLTLMGTRAACWLGVPLIINKIVIGAMVVQSYTDPAAYDKTSVGLMEMIAHELSLYIERDIAGKELIAAKEKAEQSDLLKSAFLANMSHEIRTPMNSIVGFAGMLTDPDLTASEREKYSWIVKSRSDDLLHIINDILDISRIESGNATIDNREVRINNLLDEIETITTQKIQRANKTHLALSCKKSLPTGRDVFQSDPYIIRQVLFNLLDNALKFTIVGSISYGYNNPENGMITFFVSDTGIGISSENQEMVFKTFRQADVSDHHQYGGTGLGLAICKGSVELLGGKIWLESIPGKGSTFSFSVPYKPYDSQIKPKRERRLTGVAQQSATSENFQWQGKRLVLVEDEPSNMEFLKIVLSHTGAEIIFAWNGNDLRNLYPVLDTIDLILLDMRLPDSNGWALVKEIKAIRKDIPVIAQTAFAMSGDKEKSLAAGCDDYISKPISKPVLLQMLSRYL